MIKNFKQNKNFLLAMFFLCLFVIVLITYFSRHCTYFGDDLSYSINHSHFFSSINPRSMQSAFNWHGGGCIALFFTNMFNYNIPHLFGLHPLDFMGSPHGIIKGFFTCLILFSVTSFSTFFKKSKLLYALIFISIFLFLIDSSLNLGSLIIALNHSFYRYLFPLILYGYLWNYVYRTSILKKEGSNKQLIIASICAFLIGVSLETIFFSSALFAVLLIVFYKFNFNKNFYIPISCLFLGITSFVTSSGFRSVAKVRGVYGLNINWSEICDFSQQFLQICIENELFIWLAFVYFMIFSFSITYKTRHYKKLLFPLLMQISILVVMFSLVLCGKTYYEEGKYWLSHQNLQCLYRIIILYPTLIYFSYCAKFIKINKKMAKLYVAIALVFIFCFLNIIMQKANNADWHSNKGLLYKIKRTNYIVDKMFHFYTLKGKTPYFPIELTKYEEPILYYFLWNRDCFNLKNSYCCNNSILDSKYYPKIHGGNKTNSNYCFIDNAIEKFYEEGGSFTEEEIKNSRFQNLLDNNFVLTEDKNKLEKIKVYP